ncbi:MAG: hypothetical protein N2049_09500 [Anaerolineales bacterium]|nr:hypothetical protein [Anaerolineales bacterium]MDW8226471.1 hypothetical protein [Anaerolineales bacterium]
MSPLWRGIGCLLMIVVPLLSYLIGQVLLQEAKKRAFVPEYLLAPIRLPNWAWGLPVLGEIARFLYSLKEPGATLVFFLITLLILSSLISLIYSSLYQTFGPPRYGELDAPPPKIKTKEYKR